MLKFIGKIIVVSLFTTVAAQAKDIGKGNLHARCYLWGTLGVVNKGETSNHLNVALKTIEGLQVALDIGYADGLISALHVYTKTSKKKIASDLYIKYCLLSA